MNEAIVGQVSDLASRSSAGHRSPGEQGLATCRNEAIRGHSPTSSESGFAMLLVFLMAAAIAISLYLQIPRVAFQAQRQKEQLLIERGEQYERAIQLFVKATGHYPAKLDDLEVRMAPDPHQCRGCFCRLDCQ
jgi:hypothetical protein